MSKASDSVYAKCCATINEGNITAEEMLDISRALMALGLHKMKPDERVKGVFGLFEEVAHTLQELDDYRRAQMFPSDRPLNWMFPKKAS